MDLVADAGPGPVALDTAVFIHFIEEHPRFLPLIRSFFEAADNGALTLVTSALTLLEVLVVPFRRGDLGLAEQYEALLTRSRGLDLVELSNDHMRAAAHLRARYHIRTPDALQITAGLSRRCTSFITNDRDLPALPGMPTIQLSDYAPAR